MKKILFLLQINVILLLCTFVLLGQDTDSKKAKKHFDRGIAAVESAKTEADLLDAVKEFEEARSLARDWADVYYNLGMVYEKLERYKEAVENLEYYIQLAPDAEDINEVETMINKIEYKREKASEKENNYNKILGTWDRYDPETDEKIDYYTFSYKDDELTVQLFAGVGRGFVSVPVKFDGKKLEFNYLESQSQYDSEVIFKYTIVTPGIMKGTVGVNVISKKPGFPVTLGPKPAMPMEMHKR